MLKKIAWNTFKKTGDINAFLEFREVSNLENAIQQKNIQNELGNINYGNNKNDRNNNFRK